MLDLRIIKKDFTIDEVIQKVVEKGLEQPLESQFSYMIEGFKDIYNNKGDVLNRGKGIASNKYYMLCFCSKANAIYKKSGDKKTYSTVQLNGKLS